MLYTRKELFQKYKEYEKISQKYFQRSNQWMKYTKEDRDNYWVLYQKYADIAYAFLCACNACEFDGKIMICEED